MKFTVKYSILSSLNATRDLMATLEAEERLLLLITGKRGRIPFTLGVIEEVYYSHVQASGTVLVLKMIELEKNEIILGSLRYSRVC